MPAPAGDAWRKASFDDAAWGAGLPEFGYGDGDETTLLDFGPDPDAKPMSAAFRASFDFDPSKDGDLSIDIVCDDGAVIFVDETEVQRVRMPEGEVSPDTPAAIPPTGFDETAGSRFVIPANRFASGGRQVIAVQVHQEQPASSDLSFRLIATVGSIEFEEVRARVPAEEIVAFFGEGSPAIDWLKKR
jgi:hypothetical protein